MKCVNHHDRPDKQYRLLERTAVLQQGKSEVLERMNGTDAE
jgi:hypothetical protein